MCVACMHAFVLVFFACMHVCLLYASVMLVKGSRPTTPPGASPWEMAFLGRQSGSNVLGYS